MKLGIKKSHKKVQQREIVKEGGVAREEFSSATQQTPANVRPGSEEPLVTRMRKPRSSIAENRARLQLGVIDTDDDTEGDQIKLWPDLTKKGAMGHGVWVCPCGISNTGKFCIECGSPNPTLQPALTPEPALASVSPESIQELAQEHASVQEPIAASISKPLQVLVPEPTVSKPLSVSKPEPDQIQKSVQPLIPVLESEPIPASEQVPQLVPVSVPEPENVSAPIAIIKPISVLQSVTTTDTAPFVKAGVVDNLRKAVRSFNKDVDAFEELQIKYYNDDIPDVQIDGNCLHFSNYKIYKNGKLAPWDDLMEVVLKKGESFELDLGVGIVLPAGLSLEFSVDRAKIEKFGVKIKGDPNFLLNGSESIFQIVLPLVAVDELSYVQRFSSLVSAAVMTNDQCDGIGTK